MKKTFFAALVASLFATQAMASLQTYNVDPAHTHSRISYDHTGMSTQVLSFKQTSGTVRFNPERRDARLDIHIAMDSADTGFEPFNEHVQGEGFLDAAQFPTATFRSTVVHFDGDTPVSVDGNLTIKGVSKPVTLDISSFFHGPHPVLQEDAIGANATAVIKRSDFNPSRFAPAGDDEVRLNIALEAIIDKS